MMRLLLFSGIGLAAGGLLAVLLQKDPGYVLVQIGGYTLEGTLAGIMLLLAVALLLAALAWKLFYGSVKLPAKVGTALEHRRLDKSRRQLRDGLQQLAAGNWQRAEADFLKRITDAEGPATHYLYAAEAAHKLGAPDRRDDYLQRALESDAGHTKSVRLKQAQLWAEDGRHAEALDCLEQLVAEQPRHEPAVALRLKLLHQTQQWPTLKSALASAQNVVDEDTLRRYAQDLHLQLLSAARRTGRLDELRAAWNQVPKDLRHEPKVILHYAQLVHQLGADPDGLRLIAGELNHHWHPDLALCFGELDGGNVVRQLARVEDWLKKHGEKPELLLVAGRLCLRNRLWGRARSYFEACLKLQPSPELRLELGKLLLMQGDDEQAALEMFRKGLESSVSGDSAAAEFLPAPSPGDGAQGPTVEATETGKAISQQA